jgi:hypothetical protein
VARARRSVAKGPVGTGKVRKIKALIFGPPKGGKSVLLGTAVFDKRTCPIAILDFEGGALDVLEGLPGGPDGPDWYLIPCKSWEDVNEGFERLRVNEEGFKSAAIDSLSELHIFALMALLADPEINRAEKDGDLISQPDYGKAMVQIRRFCKALNDLDLHIFYTAHDKDEVAPKEGLVKMVKMSGQLATEIPGMMSLVGYLGIQENEESGETERILLIQNYARIRTGVRTPWGLTAPDEIVDPTVTSILDALKYK